MWGQLTIIDLNGCEKALVRDRKHLEEFFGKMCALAKMKPFGKPFIERLGKGHLEGFSGFQFIETSSISVHLDEVENRAFIDVFTCKEFDRDLAEKFAKEYFKAKESEVKIIVRK